MALEREIKAKEIVNDIVSGIGDNDLMHKYRLTYRGLQSVFKKLAEANIIDSAFLEGRIVPQLSAETTVVTRLPRKDIFVPLPVEDATNPECRGIVTNITERGLGVKGMNPEVDEVKKLIIKPDKYLPAHPVQASSQMQMGQTR